MLRRALLYLSEKDELKRALLRTRAARGMAERFVAGEDLATALGTVESLNSEGFRVTLDYLGESVSDEKEAARCAEAYVESLERIAGSAAKSTISLKPTQLGLDISLDVCVEHLGRILEVAAAADSFVRIDMEGSGHTQDTLEAFRRVFPDRRNVGVVIQSYLLRSEKDITDLLADGAAVRLCKGAYKESSDVAYQRKADIDANFVHLGRRLLGEASVERVVGGVPPVAIATHDDAMIRPLRSFADSHAVPVDAFEFQMLYGVRRDLQHDLLRAGYHVRIYVPYGTEWYPYFMRRMAERPANLWFVARAVAGK